MQYVISFAPTYNIFTFHSSLTRSSYFIYFPTSEIDTKALKGTNIDIGIDCENKHVWLFYSTTKETFSVYDISSWPHKQDSTFESVDIS